MSKTVVFVEVVASSQQTHVQVCRKIMANLFKQGISPLPFAANAPELQTVLTALKARNLSPGIFVINTFWAEELLPSIDAMIGSTPVLLLRRQLFSDTTLKDPNSPVGPSMTMIIQNLTPRLTAEWTYGGGTADDIAAHAAKCIVHFLQDNRFAAFEEFSQDQIMALLKDKMEREERHHSTGSFAPIGERRPSARLQPPSGTKPQPNPTA
jgi:hypothetical protein